MKDDVTSEDFDVGVMQGTAVVSIRSLKDLKDVWMDVRKGGKVFMWCDALKEEHPKKSSSSHRRRNADESESDEEQYSTKSKKKKPTSKERRKGTSHN